MGKLFDWVCKISFGADPQRRGEVSDDLVNRQSVGDVDSVLFVNVHYQGERASLLLGD